MRKTHNEGGDTAVAPPPWYGEEVPEVVDLLEADLEQGLANETAERRLEEYGPNRLSRRREVTLLSTLREEIFEEPLVLFLVAVGVLYAIWGSLTDALAIFAIIVLLALAEGFNEFRAKRAMAALRDLSAPKARVLRDGHIRDVAAEALVPGDLILLSAGDRVPADLRLFEATSLAADESALSGESAPAAKDAHAQLEAGVPLGDRATMAYASTVVTRGRGHGIVVATGMQTEVGRIAGLVETAKEPKTPLEWTMRELARKLTFVAIGVSLLVPAIGVVLGQPFKEMVLTGLTLAFATVPEELPILITMVLAFGAYRLSRRGAIVKRLRAAETLGSVDLLLTDKTGTLTENRMRVASLKCADGVTEDQLIGLAAAATDTTGTPDGLAGDAIDVALVEKIGHGGLEPRPVEKLFPFDENARAMGAITQGTLVVKGAPEALLARSASSGEGHEAATAWATAWAEDRAGRGERVIAVAARPVEDASTEDPFEGGLSLLGLIAFADPPREEAASAISALMRAGVTPVMVTGDHPATARAIARSVGIPHEKVISGRQLDSLDQSGLKEALEETNVFARTLGIPTDLAEACRTIAQGKVVDIDLGIVGGNYYVNVASLGLGVEATQALSPWFKRNAGALAYPLAAVKAFFKHEPFGATLTFPDGDHPTANFGRLLQVAVGNGRFYGGGMVVAPEASIDDRTLDVYVIELGRRRDLIGTARYLKSGNFIHREGVHYYGTTSVRLETDPPLEINVDGELVARTPELFSLAEDALRVLVPEGSTGARDDRLA